MSINQSHNNPVSGQFYLQPGVKLQLQKNTLSTTERDVTSEMQQNKSINPLWASAMPHLSGAPQSLKQDYGPQYVSNKVLDGP